MASSERQIPSDIGARYCFWIWAELLVVIPSSKKTTSSEQIDGAKHIRFIILAQSSERVAFVVPGYGELRIDLNGFIKATR